MANQQRIIRVITRASDGSIREKEFESFEGIAQLHDQIGIDDCSTDLGLRGMPIFRGLVGPLPEGKTAVRYESPEVFETLTKEWTKKKTKRRRRRKSSEIAAEAAGQTSTNSDATPKPKMMPQINLTPSNASVPTNY
ncbi:MAG: hypothetical protein AAFN77_07840 [Planctomycetota bacterium]